MLAAAERMPCNFIFLCVECRPTIFLSGGRIAGAAKDDLAVWLIFNCRSGLITRTGYVETGDITRQDRRLSNAFTQVSLTILKDKNPSI
jgi:hypothetical protein